MTTEMLWRLWVLACGIGVALIGIGVVTRRAWTVHVIIGWLTVMVVLGVWLMWRT